MEGSGQLIATPYIAAPTLLAESTHFVTQPLHELHRRGSSGGGNFSLITLLCGLPEPLLGQLDRLLLVEVPGITLQRNKSHVYILISIAGTHDLPPTPTGSSPSRKLLGTVGPGSPASIGLRWSS